MIGIVCNVLRWFEFVDLLVFDNYVKFIEKEFLEWLYLYIFGLKMMVV